MKYLLFIIFILIKLIITFKLCTLFHRYYLRNNIDKQNESCIMSATFFKTILRSSLPYSQNGIDFIKEDLNVLQNDNLLAGILFNNDL